MGQSHLTHWYRLGKWILIFPKRTRQLQWMQEWIRANSHCKTNHRLGYIWRSVENRSRGAVIPSTQCWWCHVWNTGLPFVSTFGYVEKSERVQYMATKIINVEAAGLFSQVKRWLRSNLIAIYNYWKSSYKDDGAKLMLLNLCPSMFSRQPKKTWLWPNTDM